MYETTIPQSPNRERQTLYDLYTPLIFAIFCAHRDGGRDALFLPKQGMGSTLERYRYSYWMRKYDHTRFQAGNVCFGEQLMELATTKRECADWVGRNRDSAR